MFGRYLAPPPQLRGGGGAGRVECLLIVALAPNSLPPLREIDDVGDTTTHGRTGRRESIITGPSTGLAAQHKHVVGWVRAAIVRPIRDPRLKNGRHALLGQQQLQSCGRRTPGTWTRRFDGPHLRVHLPRAQPFAGELLRDRARAPGREKKTPWKRRSSHASAARATSRARCTTRRCRFARWLTMRRCRPTTSSALRAAVRRNAASVSDSYADRQARELLAASDCTVTDVCRRSDFPECHLAIPPPDPPADAGASGPPAVARPGMPDADGGGLRSCREASAAGSRQTLTHAYQADQHHGGRSGQGVALGGSPWYRPTDPTTTSCRSSRMPIRRPERCQEAMFAQGIPLAAFAVDDVAAEYKRPEQAGVVFTQELMHAGPVQIAVCPTRAAISSSSISRRRPADRVRLEGQGRPHGSKRTC